MTRHPLEDALTLIGYHASHEQFPPSELLEYVQLAERAGFPSAMCSDHFQPWSDSQGESGFAWLWLGAALATTGLPFGVVNAPGYRYQGLCASEEPGPKRRPRQRDRRD